MKKENICIVMGCNRKKSEGLNFCLPCYDYLVCGNPDNSQASKNDIKNLEYTENQKKIDIELNRIEEAYGNKQLEMEYNNDEEKDD